MSLSHFGRIDPGRSQRTERDLPTSLGLDPKSGCVSLRRSVLMQLFWILSLRFVRPFFPHRKYRPIISLHLTAVPFVLSFDFFIG